MLITRSKIRKALADPRLASGVLLSLGRGSWYKFSARLLGRRFRAGKDLRIYGKLVLQGPGTVIMGDNVRVQMRVTPWTYSPEAVIEIGSNVFLNGTRFGCKKSIRIGDRCILGGCSIMDTDFHSTSVDRHNPNAPVRVAPVQIGENVWVGPQVGILPGTSVGKNSVVGFGAVCSGNYPPNVIIAGNPARVIIAVDGATDE